MTDVAEPSIAQPPGYPQADTPPKRRWWRVGAIVLGALVLLIAALYIAMTIIFPPARVAALLADQVQAATGREFRIDGNLSIRVLPTIAVHASDIVLGNADWGSRPEMVRVRRAAFEVSAKALLEGRVRILRVDVEGVDALLESDGAGRFNWQFTPREAPGTRAARAEHDAGTLTLAFDRTVVADMRIAYHDASKAAPFMLAIQSLDLQAQGERDQLTATFAIGTQLWKIQGQIGKFGILLAGKQDWPFELQLVTEGAALAASGSIGTGPRAGTLAAEVSGRITTAPALAPLGTAAAALPLPLEARASLRRSGNELHADPLHLSLAGQVIDGRATLSPAQPHARVDAELSAETIDLAKWRASTAAASKARAPLLGDTPLPFHALPGMELRIALGIAHLGLPDALPLSALQGYLTSMPGRLALDKLQFGVAGGQVHGRMSVALDPGAPPRVELSFDAKSLSVEALANALDGSGQFRGGRANLSAKLAMAGNTPKSLAASATGDVLFWASDATLAGGAQALDRNVIVSLLHLLIPKESAGKALVVECAVARLPLRRGVAVVDRSIAMETHEVAVIASGELNLVDQTIRLEFRPKVKKGLGLNSASLAQLMVLSGPLQDPELGVDAKGAARGAASVGVAVATAGLSLLVPRVVGGSKDLEVCGQAANKAAPKPAAKDK